MTETNATNKLRAGGPAFPVSEFQALTRIANEVADPIDDHLERERAYIQARTAAASGMTLRQYYAGKAMQGIVGALYHGIRPADVAAMCRDAYAIADEMLKAGES